MRPIKSHNSCINRDMNLRRNKSAFLNRNSAQNYPISTKNASSHNTNSNISNTFFSRNSSQRGATALHTNTARGGVTASKKHQITRIQSVRDTFINSNCQYVTLPFSSDSQFAGSSSAAPLLHHHHRDNHYDQFLVDPSRIFRLNYNTFESQSLRCPICQGDPIAAMITVCGHIYCWPCWMEFSTASCSESDHDHDARRCFKCAICSEPIRSDLLFSVNIMKKINFRVGDHIRMALLERISSTKASNSTAATTRIQHAGKHQSIDSRPFQPIIEIDVEEAKRLVCFDISALRAELKEARVDGDREEKIPFILECIRLFELQLELLEARKENPSTVQEILLIPQPASCLSSALAEQLSLRQQSSHDESVRRFKFYQAFDGQFVFLYSYNWLCLNDEFELRNKEADRNANDSMDDKIELPPFIEGKIIQIDTQIVDDTFKDKYRFLSHLPDNCQAHFVELALENLRADIEYYSEHKEEHERDDATEQVCGAKHSLMIRPEVLDKYQHLFERRERQRAEQRLLDEQLSAAKMRHENEFKGAGVLHMIPSDMPRIEAAAAAARYGGAGMAGEDDSDEFKFVPEEFQPLSSPAEEAATSANTRAIATSGISCSKSASNLETSSAAASNSFSYAQKLSSIANTNASATPRRSSALSATVHSSSSNPWGGGGNVQRGFDYRDFELEAHGDEDDEEGGPNLGRYHVKHSQTITISAANIVSRKNKRNFR